MSSMTMSSMVDGSARRVKSRGDQTTMPCSPMVVAELAAVGLGCRRLEERARRERKMDMENLDGTSTLAEVVTRVPGSERLLESMGLDYCCGGQRSLADACADVGLEPAEVIGRLAEVERQEAPAWDAMGPRELVDHIESTHHAYLHEELPRLVALAEKVASVHGGHHPELVDVARTVVEISADLEPHLAKEERVLFPMIRELAGAEGAPSAFHCGSIGNPISHMMREHDVTGDLLVTLRAFAGDYEVPADGCGSYHALYAGLAQLEADTHQHVHKENNILFPAVLELERSVVEAPAPA